MNGGFIIKSVVGKNVAMTVSHLPPHNEDPDTQHTRYHPHVVGNLFIMLIVAHQTDRLNAFKSIVLGSTSPSIYII